MNKKISAIEKIKKAKEQLEFLSKIKEGSFIDSFYHLQKEKKELSPKKENIIKTKVLSAVDEIEDLNQITIEDPSQLIKYRQHITVPAVWIPIQGIRSANLSDIPVGKITGLDQYISSFISDTGTPGGSTNKIIMTSNIIDFKVTSDVNVFTVPEGHIFNMDSMEILTTEITNPNEAPFVRFGTDLNPSLFYGPNQTMSNDLGYRHIIESPQNAAIENTTITFGITSESLAESHFGFGIISGYLIKLT